MIYLKTFSQRGVAVQCTECSAKIKPVVALDIDGTLGDYHGHFLQFAEGYLGHSLRKDWCGRPANWEEYLGLDRRTYRDIKLAYRQGGMKRTMPVYEGAHLLSTTLKQKGAEVWITTTRPYNRLDSVDPDTQEWLHRHGINYDHLLYDEDKYLNLAGIIDPTRVVMVLDDLPEQCAVAQEMFGHGTVVIRANTHNYYDLHKWQRVQDLNQARLEAIIRIKEWYANHG
jgi:hypothetical protein